MYFRSLIREHDTVVPGGGLVQPKSQKHAITYFGKLACFEGDPVFCNTCQTWGVTKCVPPYRPHTDPLGRQANLDGDLCICRCPTPPRLKASLETLRVIFDEHEITSEATPWFIAAGHDPRVIGLHANQRFLLMDENTGEALCEVQYVLESDGQRVEGITDVEGLTQPIYTRSSGQHVTIYLKADLS